MFSRIDSFCGTQEEYIKYLEAIVLSLRQPNSHGTVIATPAGVGHIQNTRNSGGDDLTILPYNPTEDSVGRSKNSPPKWRQYADSLVVSTPTAGNWCAAMKNLGFFEVMYNDMAAKFLLDQTSETSILAGSLGVRVELPRLEHGYQSLLNNLACFASAVASGAAQAKAVMRLSNFKKFLVVSSCAVLRSATTISEHTILDIVRICVGKRSDRSCQRILNTVVLLNELIDGLNSNGWVDRASELLLIWDQELTSYACFLGPNPKASLSYLMERLSHPTFASHVTTERRWTPLFVPTLVQAILCKTIQIHRIAGILGYKHAHLLAHEDTSRNVNPWDFFRFEVDS